MSQENDPMDEFFDEEELEKAVKQDLQNPETQKMLEDIKNKDIKNAVDYIREMQKLDKYDKKLKKILERNTGDIKKKIEAEQKRKRDQREKAYSRIKQYRVATLVKTTSNDLKNKKNNEEIIKQQQQQQKLEKIKKIKPKGLSNNKEKLKNDIQYKQLQLMFNTKPQNIQHKRQIIKKNQKQNSIL